MVIPGSIESGILLFRIHFLPFGKIKLIGGIFMEYICLKKINKLILKQIIWKLHHSTKKP